MRTIHVDCELTYDLWQPTVFFFNIEVPSMHDQTVAQESLALTPGVLTDTFIDRGTGNRYLRVNAASGALNIRYLATIQAPEHVAEEGAAEIAIASLPGECVPYLLPSRYCESDLLYHEAAAIFANAPRGYARVQTICQWIRDNIAYSVGTSNPLTTARDVFQNRAGVCRDYAHLAVAFCRALNIPARFVTGYAKYADPPPDFHAIFEAYLGDRWHLFDPTLLAPLDDIIRIGTGRDAAEVAFATFYGTARMRKLSPLLEPAAESEALSNGVVELQQPDSGILLSA